MDKHYLHREPLVLPDGVDSVVKCVFKDDNVNMKTLNLPFLELPGPNRGPRENTKEGKYQRCG